MTNLDAKTDEMEESDESEPLVTAEPEWLSRYWPRLTVGGVDRCLAHLDPFVVDFATDKRKEPLRIQVNFSNHCFSESYSGPVDPVFDGLLLHQPKDPRVFCDARHSLSATLPAVIGEMVNKNYKITQTAKGTNFLHCATTYQSQVYQVFFHMRRADDRKDHDVRMFVESAYVPDDPSKTMLRAMGQIKFGLAAWKTHTGEPIRTDFGRNAGRKRGRF